MSANSTRAACQRRAASGSKSAIRSSAAATMSARSPRRTIRWGSNRFARANVHDAGPRRLHDPDARPVIARVRQNGRRRTECRIIEQLRQPHAQQRRQIAARDGLGPGDAAILFRQSRELQLATHARQPRGRRVGRTERLGQLVRVLGRRQLTQRFQQLAFQQHDAGVVRVELPGTARPGQRFGRLALPLLEPRQLHVEECALR